MATGRRSPALDRVDMAPSGPRRRRPRWHYLLLVLALLALLFAAGLVLLQRPAIGTSFANAVFARFHPVPRATVGVAEVRGDWLTHLELSWALPAERAFYSALAEGRTLLRYDKAGCGLSGPTGRRAPRRRTRRSSAPASGSPR